MKNPQKRHTRFYLSDMERPAWTTLSVGARALLLELKALYHGTNNGELYLAVREGARRLNADKDNLSDWFWELQDRGWIKPKVEVGFTWKTAARARKATCWILTEYPMPSAPPTREFATWTGPPQDRPKNIRRSPITDKLSAIPDSLSAMPDSAPKHPPSLSAMPDRFAQKRRNLSAIADTDSLPCQGSSEPRVAEPSDAQHSAADPLQAMQLARLKRRTA